MAFELGSPTNMIIDTMTSTVFNMSSTVKLGRPIDPVAGQDAPDRVSATPDAHVQPP